MTELEAINICLTEGAGIDPVSTVAGIQAARAKQILDRMRKSILIRGFEFNVDVIDLNRDINNEIKLLDNYLQVQLPRPYTVRDRKVYNTTTRTFNLTKDFKNTKIALNLDFDKLPESVAEYVAWEACRHYCASVRTASSPQFAYCANEAALREVTFGMAYPAPVENDFTAAETFYGGGFGGCKNNGYQWCSCV